jgi:hypothetical protein
MALRKAENASRHPAERLAAGDEAQVLTLPERVTARTPAAPEPRESPVLAPPAVETVRRPSGGGEGPSAPAPRRVESSNSADVAPLTQPAGAVTGEVRRTKVSNRGKENATFRWARADAEALKKALRTHAPAYRKHHREIDPDGKHMLSLSPFAATALLRALEHPQDWVGSVRNDGRKEPMDGGTQQVGLVWDRGISDRLHEAWEEFDVQLSNESFALTKANLAIAGMLHEVARADEWVLEVPNDDRFSEPTPIDRRIRAAGER